MRSPIVRRARKLGVGFVALCAGFLIVTSGPRAVRVSAAPPEVVVAEAPPASGSPEETPSDASLPLDLLESDDPPEVLWDVLSGLDYRSGTVSAELQPFVGKEVKIPGFMVPLEDWAEKATEFLLVPYVGACIHTPPPPPNQLVYVRMNGGESVPVSFWDPVWIHGTLEVEETVSQYGAVSFRMSGTSVQPYEW